MKYTDDEKKRIVQLYRDGISVNSICQEFGVSKSTIYNWIRDYSEIKSPSGQYVTAKRLYELEKRLDRVNRENEIFRHSGCMPQSPLEQKIQAIIRLKDVYNLHVLCDTLNVRRSTVYHRLRRSPEMTQLERENEALRKRIKEIFDECEGRLGAKKIRIKLMDEGFRVSPARVSRLMKELNLHSITRKKQRIRPNIDNPIRQNYLHQRFDQVAPNMAWVSDITFLNVNKTLYAICVIMDLFSRKIISYVVSDDSSYTLVIKTFERACQNRYVKPGLIFHSDQGSQYLVLEFRTLLKKLKIQQSLSRSGFPYDNAVVESFFSCLKAEELNRKVYSTFNELQTSLDEYILFYNNERPHQSLKYRTPQAVEDEYYAKKKLTIA